MFIISSKEVRATMATEVRLLEMMSRNNIRTIQELHEKSHISRTVISKLLNGTQRNIRLDTLERLCEVLNCELGELLVYKRKDAG